jgi:hypothetical protein
MLEKIEPAKHDELSIDDLDAVSGGRGRVTNGGNNTNIARGFGSTATQS